MPVHPKNPEPRRHAVECPSTIARPNIAIIGNGLLGRLVALELINAGVVNSQKTLTFYDQSTHGGDQSVGRLAAGLLGIWSETVHFDEHYLLMAQQSIQIWRDIANRLDCNQVLANKGCILVAHRQDTGALKQFQQLLIQPERLQRLSLQHCQEIEPELAHFRGAIGFIQDEGQIQVDEFYQACDRYLAKYPSVTYSLGQCLDRMDVERLSDGYQWVFDCRGLGLKEEIASLRGVRGDTVELLAPEVNLSHPIRLLHPKQPVYVVPKGQHRYLVGATQIESEDQQAIRLRALMNLLASAYSIHPGFGEAHVVACRHGLRPTTYSGFPEVVRKGNRVSASGLYRHGFLLGPALARKLVSSFLECG